MHFGETLKKARESRGLTHSQVAEETHMLVQIVQDMENEDFHRIPAPIYGRGFVRLFAECVGLDPRPLVVEFNEIFESGRNGPAARTAAATDGEETTFEFTSGGAVEPPAGDAPGEGVQRDLPPAPPPGTNGLELFDPAARTEDETPGRAEPPAARGFSRYADPGAYGDGEEDKGFAERFAVGAASLYSQVKRGVSRVPAKTWRIALLVLAAAAVLFLIVRGCYAARSAISGDAGAAQAGASVEASQLPSGKDGDQAVQGPVRPATRRPGDVYID